MRMPARFRGLATGRTGPSRRRGRAPDVDDVLARSSALLAGLPVPVPRPFVLDTFLDDVRRWVGQPMAVRELPETGQPDLPTGCLAQYDDDTWDIWFSELASPLHGEHIVVHELAHLFWGHMRPTSHGAGSLPPLVHVRPMGHCIVARRLSYTTVQEREAETLATLILGSAVRAVPVRGGTTSHLPSLERAAAVLGG